MSNCTPCCANIRLSLPDRIKSIIAKYENCPSACTSGWATRAHSVSPKCIQFQFSPVRPFSAHASSCCRTPPIYPSSCLSLGDTTCNQHFKPFNVPLAVPGPNLQRYLSTKTICPSLRGRLMLYERHPVPKSPTSFTTCPSKKILSFCQCKQPRLVSSTRNSCSTPWRCCEIPLTTYEPPFSSPYLEREFTSRFARVPLFDCGH
ncbi:uncharacterized protein [Fopius arisanus]|uniref:Uncharacterized protein n=1 Tax=Fopius arisanus TaxID=64838 RepID=A0A9R1UBX9_9HYME|nr:PREDICTED: uncharacterized protein LOC105274015 [Fopius arisanus]